MIILAIAGLVALSIALRVVFAFPAALLLMWCWDAAMPALFKLPAITYWQAYALCLLVGVVFSQAEMRVTTSKQD